MHVDPAQPRVTSADPGTDAAAEPPLPPLMVFRNLVMGPARNRNRPGVLWPDFRQQTHARLYRRGRPVCTPPRLESGKLEIVDEPVIFASVYENHFGHLVAETVPRLPQALAALPQWPIVFTRLSGDTRPAPSPMFQTVMEWLNIPLDRLRFVERPTLFREVHVAAQGEHLDGPPTHAAYLELLEARIAGNLPDQPRSGVTFVTRAGLEHKQGYHAAERYLVSCLRDLGVRIIYPETLSLREQMQHYAQAEVLVFSEGSAIHGRQLLGRIDQDIAMLRRRKDSNMARGQIAPRCRSMSYVNSVGGTLNIRNRYGADVEYAMKSFFRLEETLAYFDSVGVPLRARWDRNAYRKVRDQDVLAWIFAMYDPAIEHHLKPANDDEYLLSQFDALYLTHLKDRAAALIKARRVK